MAKPSSMNRMMHISTDVVVSTNTHYILYFCIFLILILKLKELIILKSIAAATMRKTEHAFFQLLMKYTRISGYVRVYIFKLD